MRHIPSPVIMRSLNTRKYAGKRLSVKSDVVENFELKNKTKNELATNTPATCTLHAGGTIIRKGKSRFDWFVTVSIFFTISVVAYELSILNLVYRVFKVKREELSGVFCCGS